MSDENPTSAGPAAPPVTPTPSPSETIAAPDPVAEPDDARSNGPDVNGPDGTPRPRRRGSRGGRSRSRAANGAGSGTDDDDVADEIADDGLSAETAGRNPELPDRASENRPR